MSDVLRPVKLQHLLSNVSPRTLRECLHACACITHVHVWHPLPTSPCSVPKAKKDGKKSKKSKGSAKDKKRKHKDDDDTNKDNKTGGRKNPKKEKEETEEQKQKREEKDAEKKKNDELKKEQRKGNQAQIILGRGVMSFWNGLACNWYRFNPQALDVPAPKVILYGLAYSRCIRLNVR